MAGASGAAYADTVAVNGDVAATNNSGNLKFGNVACNGDNSATATLWVVRKSANNKENFANGAKVTFTVKSVDVAGLTANSPTDVITLPGDWLNKKDDTASDSVTAPVHLLSSTQGGGNGKVTYQAQGAKDGGGTLTLSTSLNVSWTTGPCVTNTPPTVTIDGPADGASYEYGQDPTATCMVSDKEDGPSSFLATITPGVGAADGIGTYTASCSVTDLGGLEGGASVTYSVSKIPTSLALTCPKSPLPYTGSAQRPCTAVVSGRDLPSDTIATITYSGNVDAGTATAEALFAGDSHYGASSASSSFQISPASSTVTITCNSDLVYTGQDLTPCTAVASGAGMADLPVPVSFPEVQNAGTWTATAEWGGDDNHYGSTAEPKAYTIDKAPSTVKITCPEMAWFTGSEITPCSATVTGAALDQALRVSYSDNKLAGTATAWASYDGDDNHTAAAPVSQTFTIKGFTLNGFYKPVDMEMLNTVKAGSTVPLKFEVFLNGVERTDTAAVKGFSAKSLSCMTAAVLSEAPVEVTSTGGTSLRYDTTGGQFIQNWQTPKSAGSCYRVTMTTIDGSDISADFKLK